MSTAQIALTLFAAVSIGAVLPLFGRWTQRGLHVFVSVAAGVFLGTIFLHLLPELAGLGAESGGHVEANGYAHGSVAPWAAALVGLLLLFLIERVWLARVSRQAGSDPHRVLWSATFVGLGLHTFSTGLALAGLQSGAGVAVTLLGSLLLHKAAEAFSLATVMRLAGLRTAPTVALLGAFALLAPVGLYFGNAVAAVNSDLHPLLAGFATGTFLYVALIDLLPEVFHGNERVTPKLLSLGLGVSLTVLTGERLAGVGRFAASALEEAAAVFVEMAPYLLFGFLVAGVLSRVLKAEWLSRRLRRDSFASVATASLVGAPLPLCSCSVLPVAASLRRAGASKGATSAFLIATPETGVDSVTVTYALLGPLMAVVRPAAAVLSAIATGAVVNAFVRSGRDKEPAAGLAPEDAPESHCHDERAAAAALLLEPRAEHDCCGETPAIPEPFVAPGAGASPTAPGAARATPERSGFVRSSLRYAFVDMLDDLTRPLLVGVLLAGAIAALVPESFFQAPLAQGFGGLLLMLVVGVPIYVCAAASTPIAAVLVLKGLSPGAALVFLLASPATNIGALYVIARTLGKRVVVVHVLTLAAVTLALGVVADVVWTALGEPLQASMTHAEHIVPYALSLACAFALAVLMLVSLARTRLFGGFVAERVQQAFRPSATRADERWRAPLREVDEQ